MEMDEIQALKKYKVVAVVGASRNPEKDAHSVPDYMLKRGYVIIPINPSADEIFGEKAYPSLKDLPDEIKKTIEIVDIFRPSEDVANIIDQIIEMKKAFGRPFVIWTQLGINDDEAAEKARNNGIVVFQNKCLKIVHKLIS